MTPTRKLTRRSFVTAIAGGTAGVAALTVLGSTPARAFTTDRDANDRPGHGYTGRTDRDSSDRPGHGIHGYRRRSCTDSDSGRYADGAGHGRRC